MQTPAYISFIDCIGKVMKKLLLMGSEGAGKTSMHRVIFANLPAKETHLIGYTVSKEQHRITIMENLYLDLWDYGSQSQFMREYFNVKRETIFSRAALLLYVFELKENEEKQKTSLQNFTQTLKNLKTYSPEADIFILIHKVDLVPEGEQRQKQYRLKKERIYAEMEAMKLKAKGYFPTTIWDESLYQAWSTVIQSQIPNKQFIKQTLAKLCQACNCAEVVLFQQGTFLILSHYSLKGEQDLLLYERMATLLKSLKITCRKAGAKLREVEFRTGSFSGMILPFTRTQSVMILSESDKQMSINEFKVDKQVCSLNVSNVGKYVSSLRAQE